MLKLWLLFFLGILKQGFRLGSIDSQEMVIELYLDYHCEWIAMDINCIRSDRDLGLT